MDTAGKHRTYPLDIMMFFYYHLKLWDSPESMLYVNVSDAGPLYPDLTADLPELWLSHWTVCLIFKPDHFLPLKIISSSSWNRRLHIKLLCSCKKANTKQKQWSIEVQRNKDWPINRDTAPQEGHVTDWETLSAESLSVVSVIRSWPPSAAIPVPNKGFYIINIIWNTYIVMCL